MNDKNIFDEKMLSLWLKDGISNIIPKLDDNIECDVCVVGAGITGITTAYLLRESGLNVVLIDKQEPINLASGNTTAKFTFQHDLIYNEIEKQFGLENAKLYYNAQVEGLNLVRTIIENHNISCDFKETSAIVYAENENDFKKILEEKSTYEKLNIPHEIIYNLPLGIEGFGGLKVDSQLELNPVKYLEKIISYLQENGVSIFKNTEAISVEKKDNVIKVITKDKHIITCKNLVVATSYPFYEDNGLYYTRLEASRSYLIAFALKDVLEDNYMMIGNSLDPYSLRLSHTDGTDYLLVGGQGHKVGIEISEMDRYNNLIDFGIQNFNVDYPSYRWSAQDYRSIDGIPYIGYLTSNNKNIFVVTGFNKWGMSNGSFAGILITDLINRNVSKYEELFNPSRSEVTSNIGKFLKTNFNVAKEFIKGKVLHDEIDLKDIKNGEGGIIKYEGERVAAFRDDTGKLFLSDSTCTHRGCELEYNDGERSFDCPCHGSRFNYDGTVIEGPAIIDLAKVKEETK